MLCGYCNERIWNVFYLHELFLKSGKALLYKFRNRIQGELKPAEGLMPESAVAQNDRAYIIFVYGKIRGEDFGITCFLLVRMNNSNLFFQGNLRIRNDRRQKNCMGMSAESTFHTTDTKPKLSIWCFNCPFITPVMDQTAGMATGTLNIRKLQRGNDIVIGFL